MRLLFDENLSSRLTSIRAAAFPGSVHVRDVGLAAAEDSAAWDYAAREGFVLVSKDSDFSHRSFVSGAPPHVVWIRLGNASTAAIAELLRASVEEIHSFVAAGDASILVLSRHT